MHVNLSLSITLQSDVAFEYRADAEQQVMWSKVSNLQIVACTSAQAVGTNASQVSHCPAFLSNPLVPFFSFLFFLVVVFSALLEQKSVVSLTCPCMS